MFSVRFSNFATLKAGLPHLGFAVLIRLIGCTWRLYKQDHSKGSAFCNLIAPVGVKPFNPSYFYKWQNKHYQEGNF